MFAIHGPFSHVQLDHLLLTPLVNPLIHFPKSDPQGKKSQPTKTGCRLWRQLSPNRTAEYSDGNHNSQALSGDVYRAFATVGTMSLLLTPLVTDIQWPRWLKIGPAPKNVTDKALAASRGIWAASASPPGVPTVRPSRRGQWSDDILAHTHQYSTRPASASTTSHT